MPAKSEKQRRFMGAELSRKRAGERTRTNMSEDKLSEFASKEFVMKDTLDFIDNYIKKAPYYEGLGFVADNETKPIRRIRRVHPSEPSDKEIRERLKRVHETRLQHPWYSEQGRWPDGPSIGVPSTLTDKEILARAKVKENAARRRGDYDAYHAIEAIKAGGAPRREEITQTAALNEVQTRPDAASKQRVAANTVASAKRTAADNAARLELSSEFTSKQKLDYRGAWVDDPASSKNVGLNRAIATESRGIARAARKEKQKRHAAKYGKNPFQKEEVADMNHEDFVSQLDKHISHLEKRHTYTHEESREAFDRDAAKVISERQRKRDAELRRKRGLPSNNLEKRHRKGMSDTEAREFFDRDAAKVISGRQRKRDAELRRKRGEPEKPVTHVDRSVKFRDLETKQGDSPNTDKYFKPKGKEGSREMAEAVDDYNRTGVRPGEKLPYSQVEEWDKKQVPQNAEYQAAIASNKAEANALRAEESADTARREAYARRNRVQDAELFGTEDEYQTALSSVTAEDKELMESGYPSKTRNIDQPNFAVTKSKTLHSKDLLPAQDSNGNFIPNDTIPFTQETDKLMSLAADAIETYVMKDHVDNNEVDTKAARRNKKKASKRKMKISGRGIAEQDRTRGLKSQGKW